MQSGASPPPPNHDHWFACFDIDDGIRERNRQTTTSVVPLEYLGQSTSLLALGLGSPVSRHGKRALHPIVVLETKGRRYGDTTAVSCGDNQGRLRWIQNRTGRTRLSDRDPFNILPREANLVAGVTNAKAILSYLRECSNDPDEDRCGQRRSD